MSCALAVRKSDPEPFKFPVSSEAVSFQRTRSQINHGSGLLETGGEWVELPPSASIEQTRHAANQHELAYVTFLYSYNDEFLVRAYLKKYPFLVRLLVDAYPHLRSRFGTKTGLWLDLVEDDEAGSFELFAIARTSMSVEDGMAAMESFDVGWWFEHARLADGKLNFDLEYS
jgi:hypothetical protein